LRIVEETLNAMLDAEADQPRQGFGNLTSGIPQ